MKLNYYGNYDTLYIDGEYYNAMKYKPELAFVGFWFEFMFAFPFKLLALFLTILGSKCFPTIRCS